MNDIFLPKIELFLVLIFLLFIFSETLLCGAEFREAPEKYWNFAELSQVPAFRDSPFADSKYAGLRDILVTGAKVEGKDAEFFAYVGYPAGPTPENGFPGIVLIHGGGGTAYPQYAELWIKHGYAVIIFDWYNQRPLPPAEKLTEINIPRATLEGGKRQNHIVNVANIVLAHSLLRSFENVNPEKTAFVGLSWGSWYGAMAAAVDPRFKLGIEIYCGDATPNSQRFTNGRFLHAVKVPMYWVAGSNDENATPASLKKGFEECAKLENKSLVIELPHSHIGFTFGSCFRMADAFLKNGIALPKLGKPQVSINTIHADVLFEGKGIVKAILAYTDSADEKVSHKRVWKSIPAQFNGKSVQAKIPPNTVQCFLSAYDQEGGFNDFCGSTEPVDINLK
ncbi:MAG: Alpha/beta hydrolase family protein [Lentisphaerae bacterium ADurb.Bin242]|nr:MAG: Alpha/beta hydrolase family protein [Lentisphaerae bacterium ADurb.Bin242]